MYPAWMNEYIRRGQKQGKSQELDPRVIRELKEHGLDVDGYHVILPPKEGTYLNLGCGTSHLKGYLNLDINPEFEPDLVADFRTVHKLFDRDSIDGVVMTHTLPYLTYVEALDLFVHLCSILKPRARILIQQSDYVQMIKVAANHLNDFAIIKEIWRGLYAFDGMLEFADIPYSTTRLAWPAFHLIDCIKTLGYTNLIAFNLILPDQEEMAPGWRDSVVVGEKREGLTTYKLLPRIASLVFDEEENNAKGTENQPTSDNSIGPGNATGVA